MLKGFDFSPIGDVLNQIFKEINFSSENDMISLSNKWEEVAGNEIGKNSSIVDIKNHVLTIEVTHPGWNQRVQLCKNKILNSIKNKYPELEVEKIAIVLKK